MAERTPDNKEQNKNSFIMYLDYMSAVESLSDEEAGKLFKGIFHYTSGNGFPELPPLPNVVFLLMQSKLKADLDKWRETCKKNKENIGIRWNKKNTSVYERISTNTNDTDMIGYDMSNKEIDNKLSTKKAFTIPTIEEIHEYIILKKYSFTAETFFNHYESVGWMVGKSKMKNWKASASLWEQKRKEQSPKSKSLVEKRYS